MWWLIFGVFLRMYYTNSRNIGTTILTSIITNLVLFAGAVFCFFYFGFADALILLSEEAHEVQIKNTLSGNTGEVLAASNDEKKNEESTDVPAMAATPSKIEEKPISGWQIYESERGFSFEYPGDYRVLENGNIITFINGPMEETPIPTAQIIVEPDKMYSFTAYEGGSWEDLGKIVASFKYKE